MDRESWKRFNLLARSRAKRNTHPKLPSCDLSGHLEVELEVDEMKQVNFERFAVLRHLFYMLDTFLETREQKTWHVDQIGMRLDLNEL